MTSGLRVLKLGGSSLTTADRIDRIVERVREARGLGEVALVVSALGDTTDRLLMAAARAAAGDRAGAVAIATTLLASQRQLLADAGGGALPEAIDAEIGALRVALEAIAACGVADAAARDEVMSYGERTSARLVAHLLSGRGLAAVSLDARRWMRTDDRFGDAAVDCATSRARLAELAPLWADAIAVHTGFLGATVDGRTTTLGRNGSDYTAALVASFLGAHELVRWTDTSGIMTADPRVVAEAYPVPRLSHAEALELSSLGWGVLHPRTLLPLIEANIPLRIRNTLLPNDPGTIVDAAGSNDEQRPTCVTSLESLALVSISWRRGHALGERGARVLIAIERAEVPVYLAVQQPEGQSLTVALPEASLATVRAAIRAELTAEIAAGWVDDVAIRAPVTLVALVAEAMGRKPNVAGRFYGALGSLGISVRAAGQGAAMRSVVAIVEAADTAAALRSVHAAFNLAHEEVSLFVLGKGVVGSALLAQIAAQAEALHAAEGIRLRVVALADSRRLVFADDAPALATLRARLEAAAAQDGPLTVEQLLPTLDRLARHPVPILVDVTAADGMEALYEEALRRGIHVVGANKKPLATPQASRDALLGLARRHSRAYLYETTVGAGLPVIETLKNLVRTGDRVRLIEGSLSGTLGFLTGQLMEGVPLSVAVRDARDRGYTEPHPREDLGGKDAGRKALILSRELGYAIEPEAVTVEPMAPPETLVLDDLEPFYAALAKHDAAMATRIEGLKREGQVLRYLARIEARGPEVSVHVGPIAVPATHVAAQLRGAEAFVAFTTERYSDYPLTVRGAGAGGAVTAAGVLADVLRVAQTLRGR